MVHCQGVLEGTGNISGSLDEGVGLLGAGDTGQHQQSHFVPGSFQDDIQTVREIPGNVEEGSSLENHRSTNVNSEAAQAMGETRDRQVDATKAPPRDENSPHGSKSGKSRDSRKDRRQELGRKLRIIIPKVDN